MYLVDTFHLVLSLRRITFIFWHFQMHHCTVSLQRNVCLCGCLGAMGSFTQTERQGQTIGQTDIQKARQQRRRLFGAWRRIGRRSMADGKLHYYASVCNLHNHNNNNTQVPMPPRHTQHTQTEREIAEQKEVQKQSATKYAKTTKQYLDDASAHRKLSVAIRSMGD